VANSPGVNEICVPDQVIKLYRTPGKRAGFAAWVLLFYALWHRANVQGQKPQGDVFESLAA
jgi:asparagine synthase (glutamine-hydrolysing)